MTAIDPPRRRSIVPAVLRLKPLARREALGLRLHRAVDHRVPRVHAHPDGRDVHLHVHQHQPRPGGAARVRRLDELRCSSSTTSRPGTSLGVTFRFALIALPVAMVVPFVVALLLNSAPPARRRRCSGSCSSCRTSCRSSPASSSGSRCSSRPAGSTSSCGSSASRTRPNWLQDPTWIYPGLVIMGVWGIGAGIIVYLAGLKGIPTELYDAARIDGAGWWAQLRNITIPMMSPVIFYTLILGLVEVLQYFLVPLVLKNGTGEPRRHDAVLQPVPVQDVLHVPEHVVRRDAGLAAVRHHAGHHAGPLPDCRGAGSTTPVTADGRRRRRSGPAELPAARRFRKRHRAVVPLHVHHRRGPRRVPRRRSSARSRSRSRRREQIGQADSPQYPAVPGDVRLQGRDLRPLHGPDRRRRTASWRSSSRAGQESQFIDPANAAAGPITWDGLVADARRARGRSRRAWQNYAEVWTLIDYPRLLFNTIAARRHRDDRDGRVVHARGVWLRPVPVPRPDLLFTLLVATIFLPVRGDAHPDVHDLRRSWAGSGPGCRCSSRRSSRTRSTCSCCASTS